MDASPYLYTFINLASEAVEFRAPVRIAQASDFRFRAAGVYELVVADIDSNVRDAWTVCVSEEDKVADFRSRNFIRLSKLRQRCACKVLAVFLEYVLRESAAVKAGCCRAAEFVRDTAQCHSS